MRQPHKPDGERLGFLEILAGQASIAIDSARLFERLQRSNQELTLAYDATIESLARSLELRDYETEGHCRRVTELTVRLAQAMGIPENNPYLPRHAAARYRQDRHLRSCFTKVRKIDRKS